MQTLNDLKDKLDEIDSERLKIIIAKQAVEKAEDRYYDVSRKLFAKAHEILNNIVKRARCQKILDIKWVSSEKIHVIYEYCCRGNEGVDRAEFPPKYFLMDEDDYIADVLKNAVQ